MPWDICLIFIVLAVVLPWRGRVRIRRLLSVTDMRGSDRISLYASTIAFQWFMAAVLAWRAWGHGYTTLELGLRFEKNVPVMLSAVFGAVVLSVLHWLNLRRVSRTSAKRQGFARALVAKILPHSNTELLAYLALAITAGLCEEFIYRGFAMAALRRAGLEPWAAVILSGMLFGLAHLYQGRGGFVGTMLIGMVFGAARIAYDTLLPVMLWHAALDSIAGVAGPRYLLEAEAQAPLSEP